MGKAKGSVNVSVVNGTMKYNPETKKKEMIKEDNPNFVAQVRAHGGGRACGHVGHQPGYELGQPVMVWLRREPPAPVLNSVVLGCRARGGLGGRTRALCCSRAQRQAWDSSRAHIAAATRHPPHAPILLVLSLSHSALLCRS